MSGPLNYLLLRVNLNNAALTVAPADVCFQGENRPSACPVGQLELHISRWYGLEHVGNVWETREIKVEPFNHLLVSTDFVLR